MLGITAAPPSEGYAFLMFTAVDATTAARNVSVG